MPLPHNLYDYCSIRISSLVGKYLVVKRKISSVDKADILLTKLIIRGENSDEDISTWSEDKIWNHLKGKIYDSTITIVLVSPNMKEERKWQQSQ